MHNAGAINGHLDVVMYLLEECSNPININAIDEYGGSCLHWAALKGRKEVVQYLCKKGVDVHLTSYVRDEWGNVDADRTTALPCSLPRTSTSTNACSFSRHGPKTRSNFCRPQKRETMPKFCASSTRSTGCIRCGISKTRCALSSSSLLTKKDGKNALHWAASSGHLETLKLLAGHFDVLTDVDKYGRNALHWAALSGHKNCALWLVKKSKGTTLVHSLTLVRHRQQHVIV